MAFLAPAWGATCPTPLPLGRSFRRLSSRWSLLLSPFLERLSEGVMDRRQPAPARPVHAARGGPSQRPRWAHFGVCALSGQEQGPLLSGHDKCSESPRVGRPVPATLHREFRAVEPSGPEGARGAASVSRPRGDGGAGACRAARGGGVQPGPCCFSRCFPLPLPFSTLPAGRRARGVHRARSDTGGHSRDLIDSLVPVRPVPVPKPFPPP